MPLFNDLFDLGGTDLFDLAGSGNNLFNLSGVITSQGIGMIYGGYAFSPVPLLRKSKTYVKSGNQINVGSDFVFTLNGTLIDLTGGFPGIVSKMRELRNAFNADGKYFAVTCNGDYLLEGYPRISDVQFNETTDNWTMTADYVINITFDNEPANVNIGGSGEDTAYFPPFLQSVNESWDVQFNPQQNYYENNTSAGLDVSPILMTVTHNVGAVGKAHYSGPGLTGSLDMPAWKQAQAYVDSNAGFDYSKAFPEMAVSASSGAFGLYDHLRVSNVNETEGSYNLTETWAILQTGHGGVGRKAIEDFTVTIRAGQQEEFNSVNIQGRIQGLEQRTYNSLIGDFTINSSKFVNASGYWSSIKDGLFIYPRVQSLVAGENISLNPTPIVKIVGKSPVQGIINYTYEYDDRPSNCLTGTKFENVTIQDENPVDVFNEIVIMGRPQGPIIQKLNTVTSFKRTVSIDLLMSGKTACNYSLSGSPKTQVDSEILCSIYTDLSNSYSNIVKTLDSENWNPRVGRYNRTVSWTATDCDTAPDTSVC